MRSDRGVATVFALAMMALLAGAGVVGFSVSESVVRHTRLAHVADSAALAAASGDCDLALSVAAASGVSLDQCLLEGLDATVTVSVGAGGLLARLASLSDQTAPRFRTSARAGP